MGVTRGLAVVPDDVRLGGIHIVASKGARKSTLAGRGIAFLDFYRCIPLVVLDPHGPTIDNFLDRVARLSRQEQKAAWSRMHYIDMAGTGNRVAAWPLLYRAEKESLDTIATRYLDVARRLDPELQRAPILGENAFRDIGIAVGIILAALDLQLPGNADAMLRNPKGWEERLQQAVSRYPEALAAAERIRDYGTRSSGERSRLASTYLAKLQLFRHDPVMQTMYGTTTPAIDWSTMLRRGHAVLLDFRHVEGEDRKRFALTWVYRHFIDFLKRRGAGRLSAERLPISLIIDEITYLLNGPSLQKDMLADDLVELLDVLARNYFLWPTLVHQEMHQVSERVGQALMSMSTQVIGSTSNRDTALEYTKRFYTYDPHLVKKEVPHYAINRFDLVAPTILGREIRPRDHGSERVLLDTTTVEYSLEEQWELHLPRFLKMPRSTFAVGIAEAEGDVPTSLQRVATHGLDLREDGTPQYVDEGLATEIRRRLWCRDGLPVPPPVPLPQPEIVAESAPTNQLSPRNRRPGQGSSV